MPKPAPRATKPGGDHGQAPKPNILDDVIVTMRHARVFISTREKMHPTGIKLYDELLEKLERAVTRPDRGEVS